MPIEKDTEQVLTMEPNELDFENLLDDSSLKPQPPKAQPKDDLIKKNAKPIKKSHVRNMTLNLRDLKNNDESDSQEEDEEDDFLFADSGKVRPKTHRAVNLSHTHGQIFSAANVEQGL